MKTPDPKLHARHAKVFDLLRQEMAGKRPTDRAAAAAARYLDDATAERMIIDAVGSLKKPAGRNASPMRALAMFMRPNRRASS